MVNIKYAQFNLHDTCIWASPAEQLQLAASCWVSRYRFTSIVNNNQ